MHSLETIVSWAKRKWFVYPGSDIYGGLANAWDYGPYGVQLKKNIQDLRWKTFVQMRPDMVGLDAQILMHPKVWETSGHVDNFDDPLIDDKVTGERFRADKIIEDRLEQWDLSLGQLTDTYGVKNLIPESRTFDQMHAFIVGEIPNNPNKKKKQAAEWTEVRKFQMMFYTHQGVVHDADDAKIWMRPETAQGIFVNFRNVLDTTRMRVPFGIAQVGKAFRNEITPGNFLYRTREFEQMEIEYFIAESDAQAKYAEWRELSKDRWENKVKLKSDRIRFREHESDELSHYSDGTFDVEYQYPRGRGELQGIAYRTDFDLRNHQESSGKNMQYNDPYTGERYVPHVIEPSFGLSRTVIAVMLDAYDEEQLTNSKGQEETRIVARFPFAIAPVKVAIFPLIKKDEKQVEIAKNIYASLSQHRVVEYDDGGAIGKRYRRQDEIGTPYCITVDNDSIDNGTVTIRHRDSMEQEVVVIDELVQWILNKKT